MRRVAALSVGLTSLILVGCEQAGPTAPTPVPEVIPPQPISIPSTTSTPSTTSSTTSGSAATVTLAAQIEGTFTGVFQNPSGTVYDYQILVTTIDDDTVRISPVSGGSASTFEVDLTEQTMGTVTTIVLTSPDDLLATNGNFVAATGRLSYAYWFDSSDDDYIDVFLGTRNGQ